MVTVTMAIAAIPIHVATLAGWIPEDDEDDDDNHDNDDDDDDDDDDDLYIIGAVCMSQK